MPGDLSNPEFLFPFHYDSRYEPGTNNLDSRPLSIEQIIQAISKSVTGHPVSKEKMSEAQIYLESKGLLNKNPGGQDVHEALHGYFKSKLGAERVASKWLISTEI